LTTAVVGAATLVLFVVASGAVPTPPCSTPSVLTGSTFEIDTGTNGANLAVDGSTSSCSDWLVGNGASVKDSDVNIKQDVGSGSGDDSFGQGTSENDANPTIVSGSIPPNKSDLKSFAVHRETTTQGKFLQLFWSRVQNPSGTTNMDFELNQKLCDLTATPTNCANNGRNVIPETPLRTSGDKLVTYDLSKGGTVPTISIRTWDGTQWGA